MTPPGEELQVGGLNVPLARAERQVHAYLNDDSGKPWGYPHYDTYDTGSDPDEINGGRSARPEPAPCPEGAENASVAVTRENA